MPDVEAIGLEINRERFDHKNPEKLVLTSGKGLTRSTVEMISRQKGEPEWMLLKRLKALEYFNAALVPTWGPDLSALALNEIVYYAKPDAKVNAGSWEEVPEEIRKTFEKLGIPEAERKALAGVGSQYESEVVYHKLKEEWEKKGVIFENCDVALQKHPELFKKYFMTNCVPINDHKFAMLHAAVWSGGTFIYVPPGVKVNVPLQAYFRMNSPGLGQFEHTLIIADKGSEVNYIEGCSAPRYDRSNLHAGCVEIYVHEGARVRYNSVENWSKNTYNLNTKRAVVDKNGTIEWINGNMGCLTGDSKVFTNPKGPVCIKDIKPGDMVYVWDEDKNCIEKSKVKGTVFSGDKKVFRVEAGGRNIDATGNHPFLTLVRRKNRVHHKKGFFSPEWKPLEQLKVGDLIGITKQLPIEGQPYALPKIQRGERVKSSNQYARFVMKTNHLYNKEIKIPQETNEDFMWLMGLIVGDGHIDMHQNKINIAAHERDDYREHLCDVLKKLFHYTVTEKKERYIIINSKALCTLFTDIGFSGLAYTKRVPQWVYTLPKSQIEAFIAGYFDADGHVERGGIYLTSVNRQLLEDVKYAALSIGFGVSRIFVHGRARRMSIIGNECSARDSWRILLNGRHVKNLPTRSTIKKSKLMQVTTRRNFGRARDLNFVSHTNEQVGFTRIERIEEMGIHPTYDIEVDGYHNFIANGLIVHNSAVTMLYPCSVLKGEGARSDFLGVAYAGGGQNQDTGAKVFHLAPRTTSVTKSKSISKDGGITTFRGLLKVSKGASGCKATVRCDALMLDERSKSDTVPTMEIKDSSCDITHEATVGKIGQDQLFYLMSRGLSEEQAMKMIVSGFIEPIVKELPLEYAVELNRLVQMEMDGAIG